MSFIKYITGRKCEQKTKLKRVRTEQNPALTKYYEKVFQL